MNRWKEFELTGPFWQTYQGLLYENEKIFVGYKEERRFSDARPYVDWDCWHFNSVEVLIHSPSQNREYLVFVVRHSDFNVKTVMEGLLKLGAPDDLVMMIPRYFAYNRALEKQAEQGITYETPYGPTTYRINWDTGKIEEAQK